MVRVEPGGFEIEVHLGEALADAAWRLGYRWPTTCWGQLQCTLCWVRITEGYGLVAPAEMDEQEALGTLVPPVLRRWDVRLGCRIRPLGNGVVVEKPGVVAPT
jgi:2Fe-2S ferredoxin